MSLGRRAALNSVWMSVASAAGQAFFFGVFVVLAWELSKAEFGLVAYAAVFSSFFGLFLQLGYGDALVQLKRMARSHVATAYWTSAGAGVLMTALACLAAYPIGAWLDRPELTPIIQALSISCIFIGFRVVPAALLARDLHYGTYSGLLLVADFVAGVTSIAMAVTGFGVWALVAQRLLSDGISALLASIAAGYVPDAKFSTARLRQLTSYGIQVFGVNVLNYADQYVLQFLIGKYMGDASLGVYAVGQRIVRSLLTVTLNAFRPVSFSAFARLQHDPVRSAEVIYKSTLLAGLISFPLFIGVAAFAEDLVVACFKAKWAPAAPVVQWLCVLACYSSAMAVFYGICKGTGHPGYFTLHRSLSVMVNLLLFVFVWPYGVAAVAAASAAKAFLVHPLQILLMRRAVRFSLRRFYLSVASPLAVSLISVGAAMLLDRMISASLPNLARLAIDGVAIVGVQALIVALAMPDARTMLKNLLQRKADAV